MENLNYKRERLVRVIINYNNGNIGTGTGFIATSNGLILTCCHVLLGIELKNILVSQDYLDCEGDSVKNKLKFFLEKYVASISVEMMNGTRKATNLIWFDENYDTALIQMLGVVDVPFFELDFNYKPEYEDSIFFCGFPLAIGYPRPEEYPFAINKGYISTFPITTVAGGRYEHLQINSINLGGNSGAPLFLKDSNIVIGMINGNMNWGNDNLASITSSNPPEVTSVSLRVPLSIAYATSLKMISDNSVLLENLN